MAFFGGADEIVIGDVELTGQFLELGSISIRQFTRRDVLRSGRLDHLDAVLVGAGQEIDLTAFKPLETGNRVGRNHLVGVADMGHAIGIGNRGRDVKGL